MFVSIKMPTTSPRFIEFEQATGKILLAESSVTMQRAIAIYKCVHIRIVQRPHHNIHGIAIERVDERSDLPSSEMSGQK